MFPISAVGTSRRVAVVHSISDHDAASHVKLGNLVRNGWKPPVTNMAAMRNFEVVSLIFYVEFLNGKLVLVKALWYD